MKVAILGPICKETITVDSTAKTYMGGIPYYAGNTLHNLGVDVTAFVTCGKKDCAWAGAETGKTFETSTEA